jgi:Gas vesicle protein G
MGLFTGLLTLPLAPVRGVAWVAEQVAEEADRQLYDEERIRAELVQLEIEADEGRLDDEERQHMEDELFERLAVAQARKRGEDAEPWGLSGTEDGPEPQLREENPDG